MGSVNIDQDNAVEISSLGIQLEAIEDKIIVMIDRYKSGYECKECSGTGKIKSEVVEGALRDCEKCNGKGALLVVPEISQSLPTLGTVLSVGERTKWAQFIYRRNTYDEKIEPFDKDTFDKITEAEGRRIKIRPGAKVLFQPHVGTFIPIKGNIHLKIMREHEPLCVIYGAEIDTKDFMDFDVPFEQRT